MPAHLTVIDASTNDNGALRRARANHPEALLTNSVEDLVRQILQRIGDDHIQQLNIIGHGAPGQLNVGGGLRPRNPQMIAVDDWYQLINRDSLLMLRGRFTSGAVVRLHACRLAQGMVGEMLLSQLAALWQTRVQGGLSRQFPDRGDRFEGDRYVEVDRTPDIFQPTRWLST